jgi:hypothetical protein
VSDDGFTREDYERMLMEVRIELQDSEAERRRLLRKTKLLETELSKQRGDTPEHEFLEFLFDRWRRGLGKNSNTKLGPKRVKAGLAAIKRHERDELIAAVDGIVKFPYVTRKGRAQDGKPGEYHDEFEIALRDEVNVERFAKLGREDVPVLVPRKDDPFWRPLERALAALSREFGRDATAFFPAPAFSREALAAWATTSQPLPDLEPDEWWARCPVHPHPLERPMRIRERGGRPGGSLELVCVHEDCTEGLLLAELRALEWRRTRCSMDAPPEKVAA